MAPIVVKFTKAGGSIMCCFLSNLIRTSRFSRGSGWRIPKMIRNLFSGMAMLCASHAALLMAGPVAPYGDLKQGDIADCGAIGCGPAAAVNSFVFLQNAYPQLYPI